MTDQLRTFTTMKIGGMPELLVSLKNLVQNATELPKPIRILGNGSNTLIDDRGLRGTVILCRDFENPEPEILSRDETGAVVRINGGLFLPNLSNWALRQGLSGCEYMVGVPGTFGGAVVQNAGANEQEIADILKSVEIFDLNSMTVKKMEKEECQLSYRSSIFKELSSASQIVISGIVHLKVKPAEEIRRQMDLNLSYRKTKTPYAKPSLGSIFTRIKAEDGTWLYPGKLIEDSGLKGFQIGGARISPVHANYIVNENKATFDDVMNLIVHVEKEVRKKSNVKLHREILIWTDR